MEEVPSDTPDFESTAAIVKDGEDGSDALQLGPADAATPPGPADDAFAMHLGDAKKRQPIDKPSKPVTAAANASLIAALMGQPIGKKAEPAAPTIDDAVANAFARYADAGKSAVVTPAPAATTTPTTSVTPPPPAAPANSPVIILKEHDPLPALTPPPAMPLSAVAMIASVAPSLPSMPAAAPQPPVATPIRVGATPASPLPKTPVRPTPVQPASAPEAPAAAAQRRAMPVAPVWPGTASPAPKPPAPKPSARPVAKPQPAGPAPLPIPTHPPLPTGAWWTIPLTFVGIAITACAVIVPAADENRRDTYELAKIERDVDYFQRQSAVNQDFVKRMDTDPVLAERMALRQLHRTREGAKVIAIGGIKPDHFGASPYAMTRLDPPADLPPYQRVPGKLGEWFLGDKRPQQMAGLGLCVAGAGVLLGGLRKRRRPATPLTV